MKFKMFTLALMLLSLSVTAATVRFSEDPSDHDQSKRSAPFAPLEAHTLSLFQKLSRMKSVSGLHIVHTMFAETLFAQSQIPLALNVFFKKSMNLDLDCYEVAAKALKTLNPSGQGYEDTPHDMSPFLLQQIAALGYDGAPNPFQSTMETACAMLSAHILHILPEEKRHPSTLEDAFVLMQDHIGVVHAFTSALVTTTSFPHPAGKASLTTLKELLCDASQAIGAYKDYISDPNLKAFARSESQYLNLCYRFFASDNPVRFPFSSSACAITFGRNLAPPKYTDEDESSEETHTPPPSTEPITQPTPQPTKPKKTTSDYLSIMNAAWSKGRRK